MDYNEIANFLQAEGEMYLYELQLEDYFEMNNVNPEEAMEMMLRRIVETLQEKAKKEGK